MADANQESIGDYLYFFRSPVDPCTHCLILGHAGWVPRLGDKFTVPPNVVLNFRSWHGSPNTSNPTREIMNNRAHYDGVEQQFLRAGGKAQAMMLDGHEKKTFKSGESCCNYIIVKGVGTHWSKKNPGDSSYSEIAKNVGIASEAGQPVHFVSIRNRRFWNAKKYQLLGDVIDAVKAHEPSIRTFVMAGCRGVHPNWNP